jgi:hypothetical protein
MKFEVRSVEPKALDGLATRKEIRVYFSADPKGPKMDLLLYLPNGASRPAPVFLGTNFQGNHTIHPDPGISITESWVWNDPATGAKNNRASPEGRGSMARRWPVE